ncbi:MAG TPA: hypothetical protein VIT42_17495 [Microlunatus sp.]
MADVEQLIVAGREVVRISSDQLRLDIVPGLGGTAVSLVRLEDETELLWPSPWGLRHPDAYRLPGTAENTMLDSFPGGWQTIFPNGGDSATVNGAEWGFDGEARVAWCDWQQAGSSLILTSRLTRSPFQLTKIISVQDDEITVGETVKNVGDDHLDVMWGSQLILGAPLVGPDTTIDASATLVHPDARQTPDAGYDDILPWPRSYGPGGMINLRSVPPSDQQSTRSAYLSDFSTPAVRVTNPRVGLRVDLSWDGAVWPHLWYQLETGGRRGYPWFGAAYFLSLTPSSSWPALGVHEARRVSASTLRIYPGAARTSHFSVRVSRPA